jgi:GNAT superfamily N-acetyltransferase
MPEGIRRYLEMTSPGALRPTSRPEVPLRVERMHDCPASFFRFLYEEVGRPWRWVERLAWTDNQIRAHLARPAVSMWLLTVRGTPAGYFELARGEVGAVEIAYFGLLPEFTGVGLGGWFLSEAVRTAWSLPATRVWLHTCTFDHPAALPNYLSRGFRVIREEPFVVPD